MTHLEVQSPSCYRLAVKKPTHLPWLLPHLRSIPDRPSRQVDIHHNSRDYLADEPVGPPLAGENSHGRFHNRSPGSACPVVAIPKS